MNSRPQLDMMLTFLCADHICKLRLLKMFEFFRFSIYCIICFVCFKFYVTFVREKPNLILLFNLKKSSQLKPQAAQRGDCTHTAWIWIWMTKSQDTTSDNGFVFKKINCNLTLRRENNSVSCFNSICFSLFSFNFD